MSGVQLPVRVTRALLLGLLIACVPQIGCSDRPGEEVVSSDQALTSAAVSTQSASAAQLEATRVRDYLDARYQQKDVRHSFHTKFGETIDCIDFFAQPGVKALAAQGRPITEIPTPAPLPPRTDGTSIDANSPAASDLVLNGTPDDEGQPRACPDGTVAMVRVGADTIAHAGGLDAFQDALHKAHRPAQASSPLPQPSGPLPQTGACGNEFGYDYPNYAHVQATFSHTANDISVTYGTLGVFPPANPLSTSHTVGQMWTYSGWGVAFDGCTCGHTGEPACTQSVEVGWFVQPAMYNGSSGAHFFTFGTNDGYATSCFGGFACSSNVQWVQFPGAPLAVGQNIALTPFDTTKDLSIETYNSGSVWTVYANVGGALGAIGYFAAGSYTGAMATAAQTYQIGGEVYDPTGTWATPMGSGATPAAGFHQAAYVHDYNVAGNYSYFISLAPTTAGNYSYSSTPAAGSSTWQDWFYYGDMPNVFWAQNYGTQWWTKADWAYGSYKGECGLSASSGQTVLGLSTYPSGSHQAHALECGVTSVATTANSCYARPFTSSNNQGSNVDWDYGNVKANCAVGEFASGFSQSTSGQIDGILCCPGSVAQNSCTTEVLYNQNSSSFNSNGGLDWDYGYYKGQCTSDRYVAGVSSVYYSANGVVGAPHAIWCCK